MSVNKAEAGVPESKGTESTLPQNRPEVASCRFCGNELRHTFVDLGVSPLANAYLNMSQLKEMEPFYPLHAYVCEKCFLVQLEEFVSDRAIFSDYAYFSSYSNAWLEHARRYAEMAVEQFELNAESLVVELASNDGYLLQYFVKRQLRVLGIEPAANIAKVANQKGVHTLVEFFGEDVARKLAASGSSASLLIGNNVLAHVPKLLDFVKGMKILLHPRGVLTLEFPHLMRLMLENQFDTIYHEHFSYFSLSTVAEVLSAEGLAIFDVEELPTHGGSLRIYGKHAEDSSRPISDRVQKLKQAEQATGLGTLDTYLSFAENVKSSKVRLLEFFVQAKKEGKRIAGYGAPAKANTLLNYCGIRREFIDYTVDRNDSKAGKFLPGTHIPIYGPDKILETKPDYVVILPWNLKNEIMEQMRDIRSWGGQFVVLMPTTPGFSVIFTKTGINDVYTVDLERHVDDRGFFARTWCIMEFEAHGLNSRMVQCNLSSNRRKGTLRGIHYQIAPRQEAKLVTCTKGALYDVVVDLREDSSSFRQWLAFELTADGHRMLYVPEGCGHGFQTLRDDTEVFYQMSEFYSPDCARGVRWNDPSFQIEWPKLSQIMSDRDRSYPDFEG